MNIELRTYFALGLQCTFPVMAALDFAYINGDMQLIWSLFATKLGLGLCRMKPGEHAKFIWGQSVLKIIFVEQSFDVRFGALNWRFRFNDQNLIEKIASVLARIARFRGDNKEI